MALPMGFDRAIPGQSLTTPPKAAAWENPPKYTDLNEACDYVFTQLTQWNNLQMTLAYLSKGIPCEMLADLVIFTGFSSGLWTPDLGLLMKGPVMHMLVGLGRQSNISAVKKTKVWYRDRGIDKQLQGLEGIDFSKLDNPYPEYDQPSAPPQAAPTKGFM